MSKITRGTTPYHRFTLPISPDLIDKIYITYSQGDKVRVEKSKNEIEFITISGETPTYKAIVHLTQEDTLKFDSPSYSGDPIEIQMVIKDTSSNVRKSSISRNSSGRILKEGVI